MQFPKDFVWGVATAAYQIEGAVQADGRGESIWDRFSHTPGRIDGGDTGDVACDHYHRWPQDLDLMQRLGIQSYRYSIAWPRVYPTGSGARNQAGLDFYRRLTEGLLQRGITPAITLYHWDLPQALQDQGGWANRDTAQRFAEYAATMFEHLGDLGPRWITLNEPWCSAYLGHFLGEHAPGEQSFPLGVRTSHHLLLGHGLAVQAFRQGSAARHGQIGITHILNHVYPGGDTPEDHAAAQAMDGFQNRWFLDSVLKGQYPADMKAFYSQLEPLDYIRPGDEAIIGSPIDFLGVNYYFRSRVKHDPQSPFFGVLPLPPEGPLTDMGWEQTPWALTDLLLRIKRDYGDLPLYITENGAAFPDRVEQGQVHDPQRIAYLREHLTAAHKAIDAGVNLRGYYCWSLLDNFEWAKGNSKRFGLVYVDYATQQRLPKDSAAFYQGVIARNGL